MKTTFILLTVLLLITASRTLACTVPPTSSDAAITASGPTTFCNDYGYGYGASVNLTVATSGLIYQWKNNGVNISGATNQVFNTRLSGSFTCDVSNDCGTTTSNSISVTAEGIPHPIITANGSTAFCPGDSVILSTSDSFETYIWSKNFMSIIGATTSSYVAKDDGFYFLTAINMCDFGGSNIITVTVGNPSSSAATISASGSTVICNGSSVVLEWCIQEIVT